MKLKSMSGPPVGKLVLIHVNLRYRTVHSPKIQLVLRGIELSHATHLWHPSALTTGCSLAKTRQTQYKGIRITAHEVAHTLGCSHDGTSAPGLAKTFVPDSLGCPWDDGYIMSYKEEDSRSMKFSSCCQYDMARMSWSYEGWCLHTNDSKNMGSWNCMVYCFVPGDQYGGADYRWPMYLIDGSPCGPQNRSICINGDCVPDRRRRRPRRISYLENKMKN
ncbi:uncharacterized protein LOC119465286 [Dermacentor silvarum]|uniref:uncharacterized protein LOC119465286 n=1 Tax=Dermacentor silvarum TaxID=543639 RepID=UPI0021018A43|nr:uncharacterized protein LOC119465286 [Dermacentor silvarum]